MFENNTGEERFDAVGRGLADMLVTDLAHVEGIQLVERGRLQALLAELELAEGAFVDPETAAEMGKGVGARWVLTGGVSAVSPEMRLDARIVDVETSKVIAATETTGAQSEFFLLEKELATEILGKLEVGVSAKESARMGRVQTESFDAFLTWSRSLQAIDAGEVAEAATLLRQALEHDDDFKLAEAALADLKERLQKLEGVRQALFAEETRRILAELDAIEKSGPPFAALQPIVLGLLPQQHALAIEERRAISRRMLGMELPEDMLISEGMGVRITINEWAMLDLVSASYFGGYRSDVLTWGEVFLERYPGSLYTAAVRAHVNAVIEQIEKERQFGSSKEEALAKGRFEADEVRCRDTLEPRARVAACREWIADGHRWGLLEGRSVDAWLRAVSDTHDIELAKELEAWALANGLTDEAEDAAREVRDLREAIEKTRDMDGAALLAEADSLRDYENLARRYTSIGAWDEAAKVLDAAVERYPDDEDAWDAAWDLAQDRGQLDRVRELVAGAQKAGHPAADGLGTIKRMEQDQASLAHADGDRLREMAMALSDLDLHAEAAGYWERLAKEAPDYRFCATPCALQAAASEWGQSLTEGQHLKVRALYQRIIDDFPESTEADTARMLIHSIAR